MAAIPFASDAPRDVERTGTYRIGFALMPGVFLVAYMMVLITGLPSLLLDRKLRDHGLDAVAQVTHLYMMQAKKSSIYHVDYEFTVDSARHQDEGTVSASQFASLTVGSLVPILYEQSSRHRSALNLGGKERQGIGYENSRFLLELVTVMVASLSILWMLGWHIVTSRQARLLRWGSATQATITSETEYRVKGHTYSKITYRFDLPSGTYTGARKTVPTKAASLPEDIALRIDLTRSPIVLYDPRNPDRNALYPFTFVRLKSRAAEPR